MSIVLKLDMAQDEAWDFLRALDKDFLIAGWYADIREEPTSYTAGTVIFYIYTTLNSDSIIRLEMTLQTTVHYKFFL